MPQALPIFILIAVLPLGVAGQNIGGGISLALLLWAAWKNRSHWAVQWRTWNYRNAYTAAAGFLLWTAGCTFFMSAPEAKWTSTLGFFFGYLSWWLLPVLCRLANVSLDSAGWRKVWRIGTAAVAFMGIVAVSQSIVGWQISGIEVISSIKRARGLYSHPLSFAYVLLLFWPLSLAVASRFPKSNLAWTAVLGLVASLWTSESRTVQAVALGVGAFVISSHPNRRLRWRLFAGLAAVVIAIGLMDRPLAKKFYDTFAGGHDRQSEFKDDRFAFWKANTHLWLSAPITGHGAHVSDEVLDNAYREVGLESLSKKYFAHNMFLQILVEAGVVGLVLYLCWYAQLIAVNWRARGRHFSAPVAVITLVSFGIAALTQNAMQDAVVRYSMGALLALAVVAGATKSEPPDDV